MSSVVVGRNRLGRRLLLRAAVVVLVLVVAVVVLVLRGGRDAPEAFCAGVGLISDHSPVATPEGALSLYLRDRGANQSDWRRESSGDGWVSFVPADGAATDEVAVGLVSIETREVAPDSWVADGACVR
jgi:hypothetical protein